jgi:hypothetical protein
VFTRQVTSRGYNGETITNTEPTVGGYIAVGLVAFVAVLAVIALIWAGFGAVGRWQGRANRNQDRQQALYDAQNKVKVSNIEIRNQEQRVKVAKQHAEIRLQNAIGVREAQDEIAKTLTPLYVQFEMTDALKQIAKSGRNSSVVYLPSGANGIPLVATTDPEKVTSP